MLPPDLPLAAVPTASKTVVTRTLAAAVRHSQDDAPRATYKPHMCPPWWTPGHRVLLADGSLVVAPDFASPTSLPLDTARAALHLFLQYAAGDQTTPETKPEDEPQLEQKPDDLEPQPQLDPQPAAAIKIKKSNSATSSRSTRTRTRAKPKPTTPASPSARRKREPSIQRQRRNKRRYIDTDSEDNNDDDDDNDDNESDDDKNDDLSNASAEEEEDNHEKETEDDEKDQKTQQQHPSQVDHQLDAEERDSNLQNHDTQAPLVEDRMRYLQSLKDKSAQLMAQSRAILEAKRQQRDKMLSDLRGHHTTTYALIEAKYRWSLLQIPRGMQSLTIKEIVEKYGMSGENYLHANVQRAVERALRDNTKGSKSKSTKTTSKSRLAETRNGIFSQHTGINDYKSSGQHENEQEGQRRKSSIYATPPPKTPPAQTAASRKYREDVQRTVNRTMQRLKQERERDGESRFDHTANAAGNSVSFAPTALDFGADRQPGDLMAAIGLPVGDNSSDPQQKKVALTRTIKRAKNPRAAINQFEKEISGWMKAVAELKKTYVAQDEGDDDGNCPE